jgi:SAM-dependent methyltransferase
VQLFKLTGVRFFTSNLNHLDPWPDVAGGSFDDDLFGEVFEHLLNHPLGLLAQLHRMLRPGGLLLLTTPNPSALANAMCVALDQHILWGTEDFASIPKIVDGQIIEKGEIHYREYRSQELRNFLPFTGFQVDVCGYIGLALPSAVSSVKRLAKGFLGIVGLTNSRLFAICNYTIARKK